MFRKLCNDRKVYHNLYDGEWVSSESGELIEIFSPVDGSSLGKIQSMTRDEVDRAIRSTKNNLETWAQMPIFERANIFYRTADILEEQAEHIAKILVMEIAKDHKSALSEVTRTADLLRYTADVGKSMEGEAISGENFPGGTRSKMSYVTRVPLGTVLAISPFNYPVNLSVSKIAPALIGGNAVILKPPTQGALSALHLAQAFNNAGLPKGILNTVTGRGSEIGDYIVTHPDIQFINFTGSTQVGRHISQLAGMIPMLLELGGKDAAIVLDDADLDFAAENIVAGAYSYSGQRCTAVKRILVPDTLADRLVERLKPRIEALEVGDPREDSVIVPLIDQKSADFVQGLVDSALRQGATLVTGNRREGNLLYPTLLDHVTTEMDIAWEEPFGPVLPVIRVKDLDEAIDIANRSEYGLQSSVFTRDINRAFYIANHLEVGTVQINNKTERGPDHFPFLGVKASGMGTQGVKYSIEAMTRPKAVVINLADPKAE
ncbi:NADP-dependent glyceraldehyde-3-phosphate dehydrogenase [Candidatus Soleaferrea massiliensis]|uniref:NADP-dependent glyceraldehyde-3-phosphate dehydrogenase n=1 Tax=Candidatus Soleaferrea massiliensis TaxID=1470354 RepID=UPI00058D84DD|nr:NADP-dependent glyceraldehyde-3-phosphate dehydrogenase [Candidatus Soleaferrea massiliensis]